MIYETLTGKVINRGDLKNYMEEQGIFDVKQGAFWHALDRVFEWLDLKCRAGESKGFGEVARALAAGWIVLVEVRLENGEGHVVVIDAVLAEEDERFQFLIRDPAGLVQEAKWSDDPPLSWCTGRFWGVKR